MATEPTSEPTMSIGALSQATGIPVETLRTWERRYGFPDPDRNSAGHRIYSVDAVEHLRLISRAIEAGHRPANVVGAPVGELTELLRATGALAEPATPAPGAPAGTPAEADGWLDEWMRAAAELDGAALESYMRVDWNRLGGLRFLTERMHLFTRELGRAWAEGRIEVLHEHFTSERVRDFLTSRWRPMSDRARGPKLVFATLPDEFHCLGLHLAATATAMADCQGVFLGADAPLSDISRAARHEGAAAVLISVSLASDEITAQRALGSLRLALPSEIDLIVGGAGAPAADQGVEVCPSLERLYEWAERLTSLH